LLPVRKFSCAVLEDDSNTIDTINRDEDSLNKISEETWRLNSHDHAQTILELLSPGLTPPDHPLNTGLQRQQRQKERKENYQKGNQSADAAITALDPKNPVYNFLIEYYGLRGTKGVRRLLKWSPGIYTVPTTTSAIATTTHGGILLEGATEQDFFTSLHAKGASLWETDDDCKGVLYSPWNYVYGHRSIPKPQRLAPFLWYQSLLQQTLAATPILHCYGLHEWAMQYQPTTEKVSKDNQLPPSSKYQSHLKLRVSQTTLNETVESNTLVCSHVDAWKFFAKEALVQNEFGRHKNFHQSSTQIPPTPEQRSTQILALEQPACVHTSMDLLKIALKLGPFCDPHLFQKILGLTIQARSLDVAASPYDAKTQYGIEPIPIETLEGRNEYKRKQLQLMKEATPIRRDLLQNYNIFLSALQIVQ